MKNRKSNSVDLCLLAILLFSLLTLTHINVLPAHGFGSNAPLDQLAENIVQGSVTSAVSDWDAANKWIYTYVTLTVEKSLKNQVKERQIVIRTLGGAVGDVGLFAENQAEFFVGENVQVYLVRDGPYFKVVGGEMGKMSLSDPIIPAVGQRFYKYKGIRWTNLPVRYYINSLGTADTTGEFTAVQNAFTTWRNDLGNRLEFTYMGTTTRKGGYDGYNTVYWAPGVGAGTIAVATTWYSPSTRVILECDIVFNDDFTWSSSGEAGKMDVQNIATHEIGHWLLLEDLYGAADTAETMYGYSSNGETKKRSLSTGDIAGARYIYPMDRRVASGQWFGDYTQGGDIAIGDVNRNGKLDLVFVWVDNPAGENAIYYRVGWDITTYGSVSSWTAQKRALGGWVGSETQGVGACLYDVNGNGVLDIIILWADNPVQHNSLWYRIGWNINTAGDVNSWSDRKLFGGGVIGWETQGVGLTVANIGGSTRPELIAVFVDNPVGENKIYYRIGWNINTAGDTNSWRGSTPVTDWMWCGSETAEAGVTLADVNTDGMKDLVVFWIDNPAASDWGHYTVGFNIDNVGDVEYWSISELMPGESIGYFTPGAGVASADLNANGMPELVFGWVDNPAGNNAGYVRIEWETRIASHP